jgi:hypothetical protein
MEKNKVFNELKFPEIGKGIFLFILTLQTFLGI